MFQIEVTLFSQILVTIGQIIKTWQQFSEIQDGNGRHLELWCHLKLWLRSFFDVTSVLSQRGNIPTKSGNDWSNSKEMATVF